jgi:hypothetical protein
MNDLGAMLMLVKECGDDSGDDESMVVEKAREMGLIKGDQLNITE